MPPTSSPPRVLTWAGYVSFVLIGWNAVLVATLIRSLEHDFRQTDAAFGVFYFISAVLYAAGSFSGGFLTERIGRRIVLIAATLLLGLGLEGEAIAPTWLALIAAALFVNWGAGAIDGGVNGLFLDLYRHARGGAMNFLHLFFAVGALLSPFIVGRLISAGLPWRLVMLVTGAVALVLCARLAFTHMPSGRHDRTTMETSADTLTQWERSLWPFFGLAAGICFYVASEAGVSSWMVRFLKHESVATATAALSIFYLGLTLGRLLSNWIADRLDYVAFTVACIILSSAAIILAVVSPIFWLTALLFGLAGFFSGPIYPMIMTIGGDIYPHRLARLSGGLAGAAVVGSIAYPPTMGLMADRIGLGAGIIGAGLIGIPMAFSVILARATSHRSDHRPG